MQWLPTFTAVTTWTCTVLDLRTLLILQVNTAVCETNVGSSRLWNVFNLNGCYRMCAYDGIPLTPCVVIVQLLNKKSVLPVPQKHNTSPQACPYPLWLPYTNTLSPFELTRKLWHEGPLEELCHVRNHCQLMGTWSNVLISISQQIFSPPLGTILEMKIMEHSSGKWIVEKCELLFILMTQTIKIFFICLCSSCTIHSCTMSFMFCPHALGRCVLKYCENVTL